MKKKTVYINKPDKIVSIKVIKDKGKPEPDKQYKLTGGPGEKCIANGNTWAESEVKDNEYKLH